MTIHKQYLSGKRNLVSIWRGEKLEKKKYIFSSKNKLMYSSCLNKLNWSTKYSKHLTLGLFGRYKIIEWKYNYYGINYTLL